MSKVSAIQIQRFQNDPPKIVIADLGNSNLKFCILGDPDSEMQQLHEVVFPSDTEFNRMIKRSVERSVEYTGSTLLQKEYRDGSFVNAVIGSGTSGKRTSKRTGQTKYEKGYFDILLASALMKLLPNGHKNIWLALAQPPDAVLHNDVLREILGGFHKVNRVDGKTVSYNIKRLNFWDEPRGGMVRFMSINNAKRQDQRIPVLPGERVITIDIGGKISTMTMVGIGSDLSSTPLYEESTEPFDLGILNVLERFANELKDLHKDQFKVYNTASAIPRDMLEQGIRYGTIMWQGKPLDVSVAKENAVADILNQIETKYSEEMHGGGIAAHVVLTGGGSALLEDDLIEIVSHSSTHLADDASEIQFANLRGGADAYYEWLESEGFILPS